MQLGWPYPKRIELLQRLKADRASRKNTWPVEFQGKTQHLTIESVPLGMPKYNLKNGRTTTAQKTYLAKHQDSPKDLFTADPESDVAQLAQHQILKRMLGEKGLLNYFKKNPQKEPIFLTPSGFVLNGNRRLCALRELYASDPKQYASFATVEAAVLPSSDERALSDLEFNLQIKEDIRADYSWTAEAAMFRQRKADYGYSDDEIAQRAGLTVNRVKQLFDMLDYADEYLQKRGKADEYDLVDDKEFAFRKLVEDRRKLDGEQKELFQELAFVLIDKPAGDRAYQTIQDVAKYIEPIQSALAERLGVAANTPTTDELDELLGGRPSQLAPILTALGEESKQDVIRDTVADIVSSSKALAAEKKRNDFVVVQVRKANTALGEAVVAATDGMNRDGVLEQLLTMESTIAKLRAWATGDS